MRLRALTILLCAIAVLACSSFARADSNTAPVPGDNTGLVNTKAVILDMDGRQHQVSQCRDSDVSAHFIVCSTGKGESPYWKIDKDNVASIELDGITTNFSGWDYAGAIVKLKNNRVKKGYIQVGNIAHSGYRTFQGVDDEGIFIISWQRLKKIDFTGEWQPEGAADGKQQP
jgi:hypothetical protein